MNVEVMSPVFRKLHVPVGKFAVTLHHFTGPDEGDAHDHPYPFITQVLAGSYVEHVWDDNDWWVRQRVAGESYHVAAGEIHRIVELPDGECITAVRWLDHVPRREPRFYKLQNGVLVSRQWDEPYAT